MTSWPSHPIADLMPITWDTAENGHFTETLPRITRIAQRRFSSDGWMVFALNPITGEFVSSAALGEDRDKEIDSATLAGVQQTELMSRVIDQGLLIVEDVETEIQDSAGFAGMKDVRSYMAMVLKSNQAQYPLAVLYLYFKEPSTFSPADEDWLHQFTDQAAAILQTSWLLYRFQQATRLGHEINQTHRTVENLFKTLQKQVADILDVSQFLMLAIYRPPAEKFDLYLSER